MSTPFPMEDAQQLENVPRVDLSAQPKTPAWYDGLYGNDDESGYPKALGVIESGALSGIAKGQAVLGGMLRTSFGTPIGQALTGVSEDNDLAKAGDYLSADAAAKIKAFTPDAATTGAAAQILHSVLSGGTEMALGGALGGVGGAAALVGTGEGTERYNELIAQGIDPETAGKEAGVTGVTSALGAVIPGGVGSTLAAKVITGAIGNSTMGMVQRYTDHRILENAGYSAMADQQKVLDSTQAITDFILGAAFGGMAHLHSPELEEVRDQPGAREAALTTNLSLADRKTAPGIPADPAAANAHSDALESAVESLMTGKPVDVSDADIEKQNFVARDERPNEALEPVVRQSISEGDLFGEDNARDVEDILAGREREPPKEVPTTIKPVWEMNGDELREAADRGDEQSINSLIDVFGNPEDAAKFHRLASSERDSAYEQSEKMLAKLSPEQQSKIEQWETSGPAHSPRDLRDLAKTVDRAHNALTPQDLVDELKYSITKVGDKTEPSEMSHAELGAYMQMRAAAETALKHGWDLKEISRQTIERAASRFYDADDAGHMLKRFLKEPAEETQPKTAPSKPLPKSTASTKEGGEPEPGAAAVDDSARILSEKPDLTITDDEGNPVKASDALQAANDDLAVKQRESRIAAETAIQCYMRRGN